MKIKVPASQLTLVSCRFLGFIYIWCEGTKKTVYSIVETPYLYYSPMSFLQDITIFVTVACRKKNIEKNC